jgi:hypothetical protein
MKLVMTKFEHKNEITKCLRIYSMVVVIGTMI